jgi:ATP phosphoribosyltransferase regulatory subunit
MAAETALGFEALEAQAQTIMSVFTKAGHEAVAPAILQPADVFLDTIGEALRARTYVFTDPDGAELCLRPDLTLPTCRLHLSRHADPGTKARYCYNGPAFRFQPQGADAAHPREFRQAGIERFGEPERENAEAATILLIVKAIEAAGLKSWSLRIGDHGLFRAVLAAANVPDRWQQRLADAFWQRDQFKAELKRLTRAPSELAAKLPKALLEMLVPGNSEASEAAVAAYIEANGIELIGTRSLGEMTQHLMDVASDAASDPLSAHAAGLIERYVSISGEAVGSGQRIADLLKGAKPSVGRALDVYDRRLAHLANAGIDLARVTFDAEFGRNLEYYTGLVFEISAPGLDAASAIAGGGRYDRLLRSAGAASDVPAVGAAIHTERLLQAVKGARA